VLATLKPEVLALPEPLLKMIPPRPPDYERGREHFKIHTSPAFDGLAPAEAAAQHTLQFLFNPERAARLVEFHARNAENPSLEEVLDAVLAATWKEQHGSGYRAEIARAIDRVVLYDLMALTANERAAGQVRAIAAMKLEELRTWLTATQGSARDEEDRAHFFYAASQIVQFQKDPRQISVAPPADPPDGPPIGADDDGDGGD
jgi:hypothetical protein